MSNAAAQPGDQEPGGGPADKPTAGGGQAAPATGKNSSQALSKNVENRTVAVCMGLGAWGVLSGYAVFVVLREQLQIHSPWAFVVALLVAAGVSRLSDVLRERIDPLEGPRHGPRLPIMILMLGMFELFGTAWHGVSELHSGDLVESGLVLLGDEMSTRLNGQWALAALAVLWIVEGAFLAAVLGSTVFSQPAAVAKDSSFRAVIRPAVRNGWVGALAGAAAGAIGILLTALLMRVVAAVHYMVTQPREWTAMVHRMSATGGWLTWVLFKPLEWLGDLWMWGAYGPLLSIAAIIVLVSYCRSEKTWWPVWLLVAAVSFIVVGPLLDNLGDIALMLFLSALVWAVPGALLGMAVPLLRGPAAKPQFWGVAAFLAAAILASVAILRGQDQYLWLEIAGILLALIAGVVFWRGASLSMNWPLTALVLALFVGMATRAQQATFQGVLDKLSLLAQRPQPAGGPAPAPNPLDKLNQWKNFRPDSSLDFRLMPKPTSQIWEDVLAPTTPPGEPFGVGSRAYNLVHSRPSSGPTTQDSVSDAVRRLLEQKQRAPTDWGLPHPMLPLPVRDPGDVAKRELEAQTAWAETVRKQKEDYLGQDHRMHAYLDDLHKQIEDVHRRRLDLEKALAEYREHPPKEPGNDPSQWPDRKAAETLLRLSVLEHRLDQQAQHVEEMLQKTSKPRMSPGQTFELSVTASLAFWVTVGLLMGWSAREHEKPA